MSVEDLKKRVAEFNAFYGGKCVTEDAILELSELKSAINEIAIELFKMSNEINSQEMKILIKFDDKMGKMRGDIYSPYLR